LAQRAAQEAKSRFLASAMPAGGFSHVFSGGARPHLSHYRDTPLAFRLVDSAADDPVSAMNASPSREPPPRPDLFYIADSDANLRKMRQRLITIRFHYCEPLTKRSISSVRKLRLPVAVWPVDFRLVHVESRRILRFVGPATPWSCCGAATSRDCLSGKSLRSAAMIV
jgi:hypothetical protein